MGCRSKTPTAGAPGRGPRRVSQRELNGTVVIKPIFAIEAGATFVFGSWLCIADGAGSFRHQIVNSDSDLGFHRDSNSNSDGDSGSDYNLESDGDSGSNYDSKSDSDSEFDYNLKVRLHRKLADDYGWLVDDFIDYVVGTPTTSAKHGLRSKRTLVSGSWISLTL